MEECLSIDDKEIYSPTSSAAETDQSNCGDPLIGITVPTVSTISNLLNPLTLSNVNANNTNKS